MEIFQAIFWKFMRNLEGEWGRISAPNRGQKKPLSKIQYLPREYQERVILLCQPNLTNLLDRPSVEISVDIDGITV